METNFNIDLDVTPEWVRNQMKEHNKTSNDLSNDLKINHSTISLWINGRQEMTKAPKAMFYFYFDNIRLRAKNKKMLDAMGLINAENGV